MKLTNKSDLSSRLRPPLAYEFKRALVWLSAAAAIVALSTVFVLGLQALVLTFLGILFGICLAGLADWIADHLPISRGWSLALVCLAVVALAVGGTWGLGHQLAKQTEALTQQLPKSIEQLKDQLSEMPLGRHILEPNSSVQNAAQQQMQQLPKKAPQFAGAIFNAVGGLVLVLFMGLFFAARPDVYRAGVTHLFPRRARPRARQVLDALEITMRKWLLGLAVSMVTAGIMTAAGLWLLKIPMALALGVVAAIGELIPNFGPLAAAVPAVLIALLDSPDKALWIVVLYIVIQTVQSYLITPLVQERAVDIPPALQISAVVLFGVVLGPLGLLIATPLVAVIMILIKLLYVADHLGEHVDEDPANGTPSES